jgi:hypothetical protein
MSKGLELIQKKLDRADEHLKALNDDLRSFMRTEGNRIFAPVQFDAGTGWHISKIGDFSDTSTRISILAGEICYQLLSALEHSIWQMVEANGKKPNRNHFPLKRKRPEAPNTFLSLTRSRSLKNVPVAAIEVIEEAQPYETGNLDLYSVKSLANIDKHRFLLTWLISISNPEEIQSLYVLDPPGVIEDIRVNIKRGQRLKAGTELARIRLASHNRESKVYMKGSFSAHVNIRKVPGAPNAPSLDAMRSSVKWIIGELEPFLLP